MSINMQAEKTPMPTQAPDVRNHNFKEVALGYTEEQAINEAKRCLQCQEAVVCHGLSCRDSYPPVHCQSR